SSFDFESGFDYLYIYDGPNTSSTLIGTFDGTALPNGGTVTSTTGSITLRQTTDGGLTRPGFGLNWLCTLSNVPPIANFSARATTSCSGSISFTDHSTNGPTSWDWDFGDGGTSTTQSPTHTYTSSGIYSVTLTVTNANGSDTQTQSNYITVSLPNPPTAQDQTVCTGSSATLTATGAGVITWYANATGGAVLATGNSFNTPQIGFSTIYYAEDDIYNASQNTGPADNTFSGGGYFANTNYHDLVFDCYTPVVLKSVKVYAQGAGSRTITLIQNNTTIQSVTVNIPDGESRVNLNFDLPVGTNLELGCAGNTSLWRSNGGAVFPYTLPGFVSITGTNAGQPGYYYYFYDWEIQEYPCRSAREAVAVNVLPLPTAAYTNSIAANVVDFTDASVNAVSYFWTFGDLTSSTQQNPTHTYAALGNYTACLTVTGANGCTDTLCQTVNITSVGVADISIDRQVQMYPNPVQELLKIRFNKSTEGKSWTIQLTDMIGQIVEERTFKNVQSMSDYSLNVSGLAPGNYIIVLRSDDETLQARIVKQ
ncbi:MAG: PKD domain-containing protein, partial [Bacteroidia bacterium]|nr:PKD domain-containing protein [Bacteroidia bacterium]